MSRYNMDVCPKWVRFRNQEARPILNHNWDVCPDWVTIGNRKTTSVENANTQEQRKEKQKHVHEFLGSTRLAEGGDERHNHRFAGITGEAIPTSNRNHIHKILAKTDYADHFHELEDVTGPAIDVGNGKHVHFVKGKTTVNDGHCHRFQFATLIESPLLPQ
jgi:hypothetical protein